MFQRNYKVKGEDVNDFMVMQNAAFLKYSSKLLDTFLHENGFTGHKLNK
jgi:acyl-CoA thioesterase FadM